MEESKGMTLSSAFVGSLGVSWWSLELKSETRPAAISMHSMRPLTPREGRGEGGGGRRSEGTWRKKQDLVADWKPGLGKRRGMRAHLSPWKPLTVHRGKGVFNFYVTASSLKENHFYLHSTDRRIQISQTYASLLRYQVLQLSETERGGGTYVFRK